MADNVRTALIVALLCAPSLAFAGRYDKVRELYDAGDQAGAADLCDRMKAHRAVDDPSLRDLCAVVAWPRAKDVDTVANWQKFRKDWDGTARATTALREEAAAALRDLGPTATADELDALASHYLGTPAALQAVANAVEQRLDALGTRGEEADYQLLLARAPEKTEVYDRTRALALEAAIREATSDDDARAVAERYAGHPGLAGLIPRFLSVAATPVNEELDYVLEFLDGIELAEDELPDVDYGFEVAGGSFRTVGELLEQMGVEARPEGIPACPQLAGEPVKQLFVTAAVGDSQARWPVEVPEGCAAESWGLLPLEVDEQGAPVVAGRSVVSDGAIGSLSIGAFAVPTPASTESPVLVGKNLFFPVRPMGWLVAPLDVPGLPWLAHEAPEEGLVIEPERMGAPDGSALHPLLTYAFGPRSDVPIEAPAIEPMPVGVDPGTAPRLPAVDAKEAELDPVQLPALASLPDDARAWAAQLDDDPEMEWLVRDEAGQRAFLVDRPAEEPARIWPLPAIEREDAVFGASSGGRSFLGWLGQAEPDGGPKVDTAHLLYMQDGHLRGVYLERSVE